MLLWTSTKEGVCRERGTARSRSSTPYGRSKEARRSAKSAGRWRIAAGRLSVKASVQRIGAERGAGATATAERKSQAEGDGGRSHVGQAHSARGALKKGLKLAPWCAKYGRRISLNEARACELVRITRWSNRYQSRRDPQSELRVRLWDLASIRIRYGYRRLTKVGR